MSILPDFAPPEFRKIILKIMRKTYNKKYGINKDYEVNYKVGGVIRDSDEEYRDTYKWCDNGGMYTFLIHTFFDESGTNLTVESFVEEVSKKSSVLNCVFVAIPDNYHNIAIITNISYHNNCAQKGLPNPGGGDILFRFIVNHLIQNRKKYDIKRIILQDLSHLDCQPKDKISLSRLRQITHGMPWYKKYGFNFYDVENNRANSNIHDEYLKNRNIIVTLKIEKINIKSLLNTIKKNENIDINLLKEVLELSKKYILVRDFILRLTKELNKYCTVIKYLLDLLYKTGVFKDNDDIKAILFDLHRQHYFFDI